MGSTECCKWRETITAEHQQINRGDVFIAALNPVQSSGHIDTQPVVIVSRDAINHNSSVVACVPVTNRNDLDRLYPSQVELPKGAGGLTMTSVAMAEHVRAIHRSRLIRQLGHLTDEYIRQIGDALRIALDLPRSK